MSWREQLIEALPPTGDEEGADVRRDIVDELSDHLSCAMQRELKRTDDASAARRAVLERFGDPKRIACRLWFDAMKETIMNQRIAIITNIVLAAACVALCAMALIALRQGAEANRAMLSRIEALAAGNASDSVWAEASLKVVRGSPHGEPCEGLRAVLSGDMFNAGQNEQLDKRTDAEGNVSFGPIRPGSYEIRFREPRGPSVLLRRVLYPGQNEWEPLVWPIIEQRPAEVVFDIELPEELRERVAYVTCEFLMMLPDGDTEEGAWDWGTVRYLIDLNDGGVMDLSDVTDESGWPFEDDPGPLLSIIPERLKLQRAASANSLFQYHLTQIELLAEMPAREELASHIQWQDNSYIEVDSRTRRTVRGPRAPSAPSEPFELVPSQDNRWRIDVPQQFVDAVDASVWGITRRELPAPSAGDDR